MDGAIILRLATLTTVAFSNLDAAAVTTSSETFASSDTQDTNKQSSY